MKIDKMMNGKENASSWLLNLFSFINTQNLYEQL